jgi:histone H1/5
MKKSEMLRNKSKPPAEKPDLGKPPKPQPPAPKKSKAAPAVPKKKKSKAAPKKATTAAVPKKKAVTKAAPKKPAKAKKAAAPKAQKKPKIVRRESKAVPRNLKVNPLTQQAYDPNARAKVSLDNVRRTRLRRKKFDIAALF